MRYEQVTCDREGCDVVFTKKTHNQRYHDSDCCKLATNARIMVSYYEKKDQRLGKTRYCKECGQTKLSRYNDSRICSACNTKKQINANAEVLNMLNQSLV